MTGFRSLPPWLSITAKCTVASFLAVACLARAQGYYPNQEVRVSRLAVLRARSHDPSDVLLTALETVLHDRDICCGKDSALEDSAARADPLSAKDVATKLQGRHLLSDGRPIMVTAEYFEPAAINSGMLIVTLRDQHALLMEWNSRWYVCYGVIYTKYVDPNSGMELDTINKFLLLDTRYSDARREVVFDRATDDWSKVQAMLRLSFAPQ